MRFAGLPETRIDFSCATDAIEATISIVSNRPCAEFPAGTGIAADAQVWLLTMLACTASQLHLTRCALPGPGAFAQAENKY